MKKNKKKYKIDKFLFVSKDELENNDIGFDKNELKNAYNDLPIKKKIYFSFEMRVSLMVMFCILLLITSCYFILKTINFGKNEYIKYNETLDINYSVCLEENTFYKDKCLNEDLEYISKIVDRIKINYKLDAKLSKKIDYNLSYHIVSLMKIYDKTNPEKILYQDEQVLVANTNIDTRNKIMLTKDVDIDYKTYNNKVVEYNNQYQLNTKSDLEVSLYIDEPNETRKAQTVTIQLGTQTFGIKKSKKTQISKTITVDHNKWDDTNTYTALVATILLLLSLILLLKTTRLVLKVTTKKSKYKQKLDKILRDYDCFIVTARDGYESNVSKKIIKVDDFFELLDARSALRKPIIYSKINEVKSEFIVEDDNVLYKYVLKEADL